MSMEMPQKNQNILWWIASIASSVLCCAILFVLFATYLIDIKGALRDNDERLNIIREREDRILAELEMIRRHAIFQTPKLEATDIPVPLSTTPAPAAVPEAAPAPAAAATDKAAPVPAPVAVPAAPTPTPAETK